MSKKGYSLVTGSIALLVFAACRKIIPLHNVAFYIVCCVVFFCTAMASYIILCRTQRRTPGADSPAVMRRKTVGIQAACMLLLVGWIVLFGIRETSAPQPLDAEQLIRRVFSFPVWLAMMAAGTAVSLLCMRKEHSEKTAELRKMLRLAVVVLFTAGTAVQFYAPNILEDVQGNIYHSHAYTNSIINAAWQIPFSYRNVSNYGHYGMLFMPFLRLFHKFFGLDYLTAISLICAVLQGISILAFACVLNGFIRQDIIFYLALFGIGEYYFMLMKGGVYYQVHPHRMIFPILLVLLVLKEKTGKKYHSILAVILITLSIIWSTEVGMVLMVAYALYRWMDHAYDEQGLTLKKCLDLIPKLLFFALLPFAAAYVLVNAYNLMLGGEWLSFEVYMFPLITEKGYLTLIELELPGIWNAWTANAILFLGAVVVTVIPVLFPGRERQELQPVVFFMGTMGLGIMIYYVNRPVEGCLFVNIYIILILLAVSLQKAQDVYLDYKKDKKILGEKENVFSFLFLRVIVTFLLFVMAFDTIYSMPDAWKASRETIWKRDELIEFAKHIEVQVPPDAVSFGMAVPEILSLIDRDTHSHSTDWGIHDMSDDVLKEVRYELEKGQWLFCNTQSLYELQEKFPGLTDQYEYHESFVYDHYEFALFDRKGGQ